jgi:cyclopropane fatty-acyl-phospholipid synthase-like methyltransferase
MSDELRAALEHERYPRSARYDPQWVLESSMGSSNVLWATEALCEKLPLEPGMRVLDLACGTAHSSIFLAKEFGVTVWAVDFLVDPTANWRRIEEAGLGDKVFPLRADARYLPFPNGMFDVVTCLGSYKYFGTDDLFLQSLVRFLREDGRIGIVTAGVRTEMDEFPADVSRVWKLQIEALHSPEWWRHHFERGDLVQVEVSDLVPEGGRDWARWYEICAQNDIANPAGYREDAEMLRDDDDERWGLVRLVARLSPDAGARAPLGLWGA